MRTLRIGSRGSPLALWQTHFVRDSLLALREDLCFEIVEVKTLAEKFPEREATEIGTGIFTRELDDALIRGDVDFAVHSLKDVPSEIPEELVIASVPERECPLDAFVSADGTPLEDLPTGAKIGTGSPRRKAQLLHRRPDLAIVPLRGNVATRISKMHSQGIHGIVLAHAGLRRLGEERLVTHLIDPRLLVPAVSQGALGLVARRRDAGLLLILRALEHEASRRRTAAERAFLRRLRGGCHVPAGALATLDGEEISIRGVVAAPDGTSCVRGEVSGSVEDAEELGRVLADEILERGGSTILREIAQKAHEVPLALDPSEKEP
jgi:hydroxymethylbilane synthase